jgi:hypothetical protein
LPLPDFIAKLYVKRFGKPAPDPVRTIEQMAEARAARKEAKKRCPQLGKDAAGARAWLAALLAALQAGTEQYRC